MRDYNTAYSYLQKFTSLQKQRKIDLNTDISIVNIYSVPNISIGYILVIDF